jgi:hypothetical protein
MKTSLWARSFKSVRTSNSTFSVSWMGNKGYRQAEERLASQPLVKVAAGDNRAFWYLRREYRPVQGYFYLPAEAYRKFKSINASAWRDYELVSDLVEKGKPVPGWEYSAPANGKAREGIVPGS